MYEMFFFKRKTAYDMRISDWSSDVCSSDLKAGSGKSVLLQELCAALRGAGSKVVVIVDGRSFEHAVKLQGGRFVEFTLSAGFSLNPFSMVDDARAEACEYYSRHCFAQIGRPSCRDIVCQYVNISVVAVSVKKT